MNEVRSPSSPPTLDLVDGRRRVVVLALRPEIDGGRYPVKRTPNEPLVVEADLACDGHDVVRAVFLHRHAREPAWIETEAEPIGNDAWRATLALTRLGRHRYTILAWVDTFATWRRGLERKYAAGSDVHVELLEGALLVDAAVARGAALAPIAALLRSDQPVADRVAHATTAALAAEMARFPDRSRASQYRQELEVLVERPLAQCSAWYELFPRSTRDDGTHGTFADAEARLPYVRELGFDIVYLPPIHPIGSAYRKGPDNAPIARPGDPGSPWAIGNREGGHTSVHPELGTLADFDRFLRAARDHDLEVALDIAFQASPDHPWVKQHPTWFKQRPDGTIQYAENPPKKYQDVYPFDFESEDWRALWQALRDVFVFWCERGVRVFRVDNPHTKPIPFWEWCLGELHARYPDAMFLSEAFTRPKLMYALAKSGFSQSYTYFTWRTTKPELERYLEELTRTEVVEFFRPSFWPTTPDIFPDHLVHGGRAAFVLRLVLAGTLTASYGIYGPSYELMEHQPRKGPGGEPIEELANNEKYQIRTWDLERPDSLRHVIARLNRIRRANPALHDNRSLRFHYTDNDLVVCYSKRTPDRANVIVTVVNLDPHHTHRSWLELDLAELGIAADESFQVHDLLGDARFQWRGSRNFVELDPDVMPAHVFEIRRFVRTENQFEYFL
ncbi:MAG TPA: alpha-1,4-glucan--maltose-1-phosphate maltosyltransferase [Kofleriaceae bacterium]|nr:alpha-1,4-glucan--maltose-1-phosphate maltosyltransferase [Kofleriaceae bacterium]